MTDEERAVIDAAFRAEEQEVAPAYLTRALKALVYSEQPPAPVFPDPPTVWQRDDGFILTHIDNFQPPTGNWRKLTYTPDREPLPAERIAELQAQVTTYRNAQISTERGYNERGTRIAELEAELHRLTPDDLATFHAERMNDPAYAAASNALQPAPEVWDSDYINQRKSINGKPAPVTHERWGVLYCSLFGQSEYDIASYSEEDARRVGAQDGRKLVRIVATEVPT